MLDHPLRLAVGSHSAGSGKGCAMNVISWESGDTTITDLPACADPLLAELVQRVNDTICTHRDGDLLCPACSQVALRLAHRTVGTGGPLDSARQRVWVRVAVDQARQVLHLASDKVAAGRAIAAAEAWADEPSEENRKTASDAAAAYAAYAAYAALADRAIDVFLSLTGITEQTPISERTAAAYAAMTGH